MALNSGHLHKTPNFLLKVHEFLNFLQLIIYSNLDFSSNCTSLWKWILPTTKDKQQKLEHFLWYSKIYPLKFPKKGYWRNWQEWLPWKEEGGQAGGAERENVHCMFSSACWLLSGVGITYSSKLPIKNIKIKYPRLIWCPPSHLTFACYLGVILRWMVIWNQQCGTRLS